jgi:flagellar hook-associated protein 1 FlgK
LRVLDDGLPNAIDINSVTATATVTTLASGVPQLPFFLDANFPYTGAITGNGSEMTGLAGRITVNSALVADPSKLVVYNTSPLTPSGDSTRPSLLYNQLTAASLTYLPSAGIGTTATPFTGTLPSYLREVLSQQGSAADSAKNLADGQDLVVNSLKQRFNDGASVSVDEEMSNLLILQNTYGANARVISAVKEMFQALLNI